MNGILAKRICDGDSDFLIEATPTTERIAPAPKIAPAEKHISSCLKCESRRKAVFPWVGLPLSFV